MSELLESAKLELKRFDKLSYANSLLLVERLEEFEAVKAERDRAVKACEQLAGRLVEMEKRQAEYLEEIAYLKESHHAMSECIGMYSAGNTVAAEKFRDRASDIFDARLEQLMKRPIGLEYPSPRGMGDASDKNDSGREKLDEAIKELLKNITPVYATSKNTSDVREGYALGGYVKYYKIEPHIIHIVKSEIQDG